MPLHQIRCKLGQNMNYWFWSVCLVEIRKNPPNSLPELVNTVERYAASLNKDQIITAVNDILPIVKACIEYDGGALSTNRNPSRKDIIVNLFMHIIYPQMSNIRQCK